MAYGNHAILATPYDNPGNTNATTITITIDNKLLSTPTEVTTTAVSGTQINLTWTASTDAIGVAGYDIYRGGIKINTGLVNTTSYNDTGLTPATSYSYYVKAIDKVGSASTSSSTASATTRKTADINGDGKVDIFDLSILLTRWGSSNVAADLNSSGIVDIFDLSILLSRWGT